MKQEVTNVRIHSEPCSEYLESTGENKALSSQHYSTLVHVTLTMMALLVIKLLIVLVFMAVMNNQAFSIFQKCIADNKDVNSTFQNLQTKFEHLQSKYSKLEGWSQSVNQSCELSKITKGGNYIICPDGWLKKNSSCYFVSRESMPWNSAKEDCLSRQSKLLVINSESEQIFISKTIRCDTFWIGLNDMDTESTFVWEDGNALDSNKQFWSEGQPDNYNGSEEEDCVTIRYPYCNKYDFKNWNDLNCTYKLKYICEKEADSVFRLFCEK
ncbi:CD209 antigen-like protein E [Bombina bombina]|uniref:CD209 antigen-like protein E n=1 Tax=Bombina bombina TaxID=8345 RepID=UPI00235ADDE7|nr:CD209 antigen-like protein E [Bombina bombina]